MIYSLIPAINVNIIQTANDCVANALDNVLFAQTNLSGNAFIGSRAQVYHDEQLSVFGNLTTDGGSFTHHVLDSVMTVGIANENKWQYGFDAWKTTPAQSVYDDAKTHKIMSVSEIAAFKTLPQIAQSFDIALQQGKPILLSLSLKDWFFNETGSLETQNSTGLAQSGQFNHAVAVVGKLNNEHGGTYVVKNSWDGWGDNGYGTISLDGQGVQANDISSAYIINSFNGFDWTFTDAKQKAASLYACVLDRAAENSGCVNVAAAIEHGVTLAELADGFVNSAEGLIQFPPSWDSAHTANAIYQHVLGRDGDAQGLANLIHNLDTIWSKGTALAFMMGIIDNYNGLDAVTKLEAQRYDNRTELSEYYAVALQGNGNDSHVILTGVTADIISVEAAKQAWFSSHLN